MPGRKRIKAGPASNTPDGSRPGEAPSSPSTSLAKANVFGPELFLGVVAPMGAPTGALTDALRIVMDRVSFSLEFIRLTEELSRIEGFSTDGQGPDLPGLDSSRSRSTSDRSREEEKYWSKIEMGNKFCELMEEPDALVALGIKRVGEIRSRLVSEGRQGRQIYYFHSLKRPKEVDGLRDVYGDSFVLISAHAPRDARVNQLSKKLASSDLKFDPDLARGPAEKLLTSDEFEGKPYGQNVQKTFPKADFFINVGGTRQDIIEELWRFVGILFGNPFHTPKPDEQGMAVAYLAALRSSHPVRQVGAAITTADGSIVSIGCNEVPRSLGGLYWPDDKDDRRDFQLKEYESLALRQEVLSDILQRLGKLEFIKEDLKKRLELDQEGFFEDMNSGVYQALRDSRLMDALEYDRTVHAEMAAITDASRRGVRLSGCTLYCTTFPCHNCARHIVAAGIKRVVYIDPFSKSLAKRLHGDAICVDAEPGTEAGRVRFDPFLGISPNLYYPFFTIRQRLDKGGRWRRFIKWDQRRAKPIIGGDVYTYLRNEYGALEWLSSKLREKNVGHRKGSHEPR